MLLKLGYPKSLSYLLFTYLDFKQAADKNLSVMQMEIKLTGR